VPSSPNTTTRAAMDIATKIVVWTAAAVVIVAGVTFISNDSAQKNAASEAECRERISVQAACLAGGRYSKECLAAVKTCVKRGY